MQKGLTELIFILDKSGSMQGLEKDTIGGFNSMLQKQREVAGEVIVTTVLFDNEYDILHDRLNIQAISPMTKKEYQTGGSTALLDAMGITINKIIKVQKSTAEAYQAEKVIFIIITDGEENASKEFSSKKVKKLVERQKNKFNWEFIFLGANIDAIETAQNYGISANRAQEYYADEEGTALNFSVLDEIIGFVRFSESIPDDWNADIKRDIENRKKK